MVEKALVGVGVRLCSAGMEDPSPKDSRSDGTSENGLNDDRKDPAMMIKIE